MNNDNVNLYDYYNNYVFLHNFAWSNVGEFQTWLDKMRYFFYYISSDMSALTLVKSSIKDETNDQSL